MLSKLFKLSSSEALARSHWIGRSITCWLEGLFPKQTPCSRRLVRVSIYGRTNTPMIMCSDSAKVGNESNLLG